MYLILSSERIKREYRVKMVLLSLGKESITYYHPHAILALPRSNDSGGQSSRVMDMRDMLPKQSRNTHQRGLPTNNNDWAAVLHTHNPGERGLAAVDILA